MKRIFLLFLFIIFYASPNSAQDLTVIRKTNNDNFSNSKNAVIISEYAVLSSALLIRDTIKYGFYKEYYSDGNVSISGFYKNNKKDSVWSYYDQKNNVAVSETYKNDFRDGVYIHFCSGKPQIWGEYSKGNPVGKWTYNDIDNTFCQAEIYYDEMGSRDSAFSYYPNHKIYMEERYSYKSGSSIDSASLSDKIKTQKENVYRDNNTLYYTIEFKDTLVDALQFYDLQGQKLPMGTYKNGEGTLRTYYENGVLYRVSNFKNYVLEGYSKIYNEEGVAFAKVNYEKDACTTFNCYFKDGYSFIPKGYKFLTSFPRFSCNTSNDNVDLTKFIAKNVRYPSEALENNKKGTCAVKFIINNIGELSDAEMIRDIDGYFREECLRVIKLMKPWYPALERGLPVEVPFTFPIKFIMQ